MPVPCLRPQVPAWAPIAVNVKVQVDAEAREREEMKRLTLMANRCVCVGGRSDTCD